MLWRGLGLTILVGLGAMGLAVTFGLLGAWGKLSRYRAARWLAGTYTTVIRGVPELILILLVYYGVPTLIQDLAASAGHDLRVDLNPFVAGIATIGLIYGAFATEVFRGAFQAVPRGQIEAARAFGMGRALMLRRVVLPQMWRFALPGLGNVLDGPGQGNGADLGDSARGADAERRYCRPGDAVAVHLLLRCLSVFTWVSRSYRW